MGTALVIALIGIGAMALGVLVGRYYIPDDRATRRTAAHSESYMRTIGHLLSRDNDAAVTELRDVVKENVEYLEPYFALGSLFRSRGEWERAVRVHQAICVRDDATANDQLRARYELGLDFRAAGMPRRATRAMEECLADDSKHVGALRALCGLYEEQGLFSDAADAWGKIEKITGQSSARRTNLLAAAAQRALADDDVDAAKKLAKAARKRDPDSAHVAAAWAELAAARGDAAKASSELCAAIAADPGLAVFLVPGLVEAERQQLGGDIADEAEDESRYIEAMRRAAEALDPHARDSGNPQLRIAVAELRSHFHGEAALEEFRTIAEEHPDFLPARVAAARVALAAENDEAIADELRALVGRTGALSWVSDGSWRCGNCGERDSEFFWRCNNCRQWATGSLDLGRAAQPVESPRERRAQARKPLFGRADKALPASSLAAAPRAEARGGGSIVGRAGSWLSGAFSRVRGRKPKT